MIKFIQKIIIKILSSLNLKLSKIETPSNFPIEADKKIMK